MKKKKGSRLRVLKRVSPLKFFMKLLVTRDQREEESFFFKLQNNRIERLIFPHYGSHDLIADLEQSLILNVLPIEIVMMILKRLFIKYLRSFNFDLVMNLAMCNKVICSMIYFQCFGIQEKVSVLEKMRRLSKTFNLLEEIHDQYVTTPNMGHYSRVALMLTRFGSLNRQRKYHPWDFESDFDLLDMEEIDNGTLVFPGRFYGDTVLVHGVEMNGIIDYQEIEHPVFVFGLRDYTDALIPNEKSFFESVSFRYFSRLIKACYGEQTGIYFMVKPHNQFGNPFITASDTLVSF
jgi:hypothetical protein